MPSKWVRTFASLVAFAVYTSTAWPLEVTVNSPAGGYLCIDHAYKADGSVIIQQGDPQPQPSSIMVYWTAHTYTGSDITIWNDTATYPDVSNAAWSTKFYRFSSFSRSWTGSILPT